MQSISHEIDWLKARVSQDPGSMFYARLADRYLKENDVDQAMECAEKAALMHPHDATARFVLAKCCYVQQDFDKADKNLNQVLELDPQHFGALDLQTDLFGGQGEPDRAQENINRLIDLDPLNEAVHLKTAVMPQPSAKESFEDEWNAALLPEEERPAPKMDAESDAFADFEAELPEQKSSTDESDLDSRWDTKNSDELFDSEKSADSFLDEPLNDDSKRDSFENEPFQDEPYSNDSFLDEPLPTEPLPDESIKTKAPQESFDDNPFADFENSSFDDETPGEHLEDLTDNEKPMSESNSFESSDSVKEDFSSDDVLDDTDDDDFEIDQSKFREEKSKFTRLLDDIFSSSIDKEEQREHDERSAIERIADSEPLLDESAEPEQANSTDDFEPLMPADEIILPEEKILESDRSQHDDSLDVNETENGRDESDSVSQDFSRFLDSLDIKDDSKDEKDLPDGFDDPMPKLDDDFAMSDDLKNILEPLSGGDDWTQDLSDAAVDEKAEESSDQVDSEPEPEPTSETDQTPDSTIEEDAEPSEESQSSKDEKGKFYTPTLGEIYAAQGQYAKAISVYENLLKNDPDNEMYHSKLELLRKKLAEQE